MVSYYNGPRSPHFDGSRFFNPWNPRHHSFLAFLRWRMTAQPKHWPDHLDHPLFDHPPAHVENVEMRVSFVGHSTVLIQTQGLNIITDPVWSEWATPFKWSRTKRIQSPGILFEDLPKIDLILISHNHYDHLDQKTIHKIWERDQPMIVTPLGNDTIIQSYHPTIQVTALDWDQSLNIKKGITIHLLPAQHWSARSLCDRDKALWGAFVIETNGGNIYFAGDTGYCQHLFQQAKKKFGAFRFAMLPIGAYEPRWFMQYQHMNPNEAVLAHLDLGEPYTLAIHFGTFRLSDEGFKDPILALTSAKETHHIPENKFRTLEVGEPWLIPEKEMAK